MFHYLRKKRISIVLEDLFGSDPYFGLVQTMARAFALAAAGQQNKTFVDSSTNNAAITANGTVSQGSFSPYASGGNSYMSVTKTDYLSIPANESVTTLTGDFTLEAWVNPQSSTLTTWGVCDARSAAGASAPWLVCLDTYVANSGYLANLFTGSNYRGTKRIPLYQWTHLVYSRQGTNLRLFVNGVLDSTFTVSGAIVGGGALTIGNTKDSGQAAYGNIGYVSDLRIVNGTAVYTSGFSVPTLPLTSVQDTAFLLSANSAAISDATSNTDFITVGNASANTAVEKFSNPSLAFNGSTDYLQAAYDEGKHGWRNQANYTLEFWAYHKSYTAGTTAPVLVGHMFPTSANATTNWSFGTNAAGQIQFYYNTGAVVTLTGALVPLHKWCHFAFVKSGNNLRIYLDGMLEATAILSTAPQTTAAPLTVGARYGSFFNGYMDDIRITPGVARYTNDFVVDTQLNYDPYAANSISLIGSGVDNATNKAFIDSSPNAIALTTNGIPAQGTFTPFSCCGFSNYFNGTSALTLPMNSAAVQFGADDFTIEAWVYKNSNADMIVFGGQGAYASNADMSTVFYAGPTALSAINVGATNYTITSPNPAAGVWSHVAMVRSGSTLTTYLNGFVVASISVAGSVNVGTATYAAEIGGSKNATNAVNPFIGYISNARITKSAVYTENFTATAAQLAALANTTLLTCTSNRFIDKSSSPVAITTTGLPSVQTFTPFTPSLYSAETNGGAITFAAGSNLSTPTTNIVSGTLPFTVEFWYYPTGANVGGQIFLSATSGILIGIGSATSWGRTNQGSWAGATVTSSMPITNQWNHIVITREGTGAGQEKLYLNGAIVGTGTNATNYADSVYSICGTNINGHISDMRVVNGTALYAGQTSISLPTAPLSVVANTKLWLQATNFGVYEASGKTNVITFNNAKVSNTVVKFAQSMYFDGASYLTIPYSPLINLSGNGATPTNSPDFTIEAWIYHTVANTAKVFIGKDGVSGTSTYGYDLGLTAANLLVAHIGTGTLSAGNQTITGVTAIAANTWTHVALVKIGSIVKLFVNGMQDASATVTPSMEFGTSALRIGQAAGGGAFYTGYIEDLRVTRGVARYRTGFPVPTNKFGSIARGLSVNKNYPTVPLLTGGDPYYNQVTLHMHFNAVHGSKIVSDQKGHIVTVPANVYQTALVRKFDSSSLRLPGTAGVTIAGSTEFVCAADFTFEGFVYFNNLSSPANQYIFDFGSNGLYFRWNAGSWALVSGASSLMSWTNTPELGVWHHWAIVRSGSTVTLYVNGVGVASYTSSAAFGTASAISLGNYGGGGSYGINGYIDEVRFTKGVARYTANFTTPTSAFPDYQAYVSDPYIANSLVIRNTGINNGANDLYDLSANAYAVTKTGIPAVSTASPYQGSGSSIYFNGASYVSAPTPAFTGDFTISLWIKVDVMGSDQRLVGTSTGTSFDGLYINSSKVGWHKDGVGAIFSTTSPVVGSWMHILVTKSGTTESMYINGVREVQRTLSSAYTAFTMFGQQVYTNYTQPLTGHLSDIHLIDGTALYAGQSSFTVPTSPETAVANTRLLLAGSAVIVEANNKLPVASMGAVKVSMPNHRWSSSFAFTGASDLLAMADKPATQLNGSNWTIEAWIFPTGNYAAANTIMSKRNAATATCSYELNLTLTNGYLSFYNGTAYSSTATPTANTWNHVAATMDGTTLRLFLNGSLVYTGTIAATVNVAYPLYIGNIGSGTAPLYGLMEDPRITKGIARYISSFTLPVSAFPVA